MALISVGAFVALAMLVWAEWDRLDTKAKAETRIEKLTDRLALQTAVDVNPAWYPGCYALGGETPTLQIVFRALRPQRLNGRCWRCTVENPEGLSTVADVHTPELKPGSHLSFHYPNDFSEGPGVATPGTYRVLLMEPDDKPTYPMDHKYLCAVAFEVEAFPGEIVK